MTTMFTHPYTIGQDPYLLPNDFAAFAADPKRFITDAVTAALTTALANYQLAAPAASTVDPDELHDVPAAAKLLGVVPQTIHDYVKREILTPLRLRPGGKLYFKKCDLMAALSSNVTSRQADGRRKAARFANKKA